MNRQGFRRSGHGPANLCGIFDMPWLANDLGVVEPFVAMENSRTNPRSAVSVDGMRSLLAHSGTACRAPTEARRC